MGGYKVAIVGAGRLGTLLATRIPASYRKVIISRERAEASALADEVGGIAADNLSAVRGCQVVFLALPGADLARVVREMTPHLAEGALVANMAPDMLTTDLAAEFTRVNFAAAKVIGHTRELALGTPGIVVLDHVDEDGEDRLTSMLSGLGPVIRGRESMVLEVETAIAEVMVETRDRLTARLQQVGLSGDLVQTAMAGSAAGVLWSLTLGLVQAPARGIMDTGRTGLVADPPASH